MSLSISSLPDLPVRQVLPDLLGVLRSERRALLVAPPGAGKTTLVPPALIEEEWLDGGKVLMLEPRRVAARNAAWRIADLLGEKPGDRVGYRMRGESRVGPATRIEVLTEGTLTAMFRTDPSLSGVGAILFDEFHERSVHADLGLALALHASELFRPDLRIVVMSATLETKRLVSLLDDAPVVRSSGKLYPVDTRYLGRDRNRRIEDETAGAVRRALGETEGDILVFLPGSGEISRTEKQLADLPDDGVEVHVLHGSLSRAAQDRALFPSPSRRRKVILSSAIAETSLTIEGVGVVIDAGLSRVPRFDPNTGLTRLSTVRVSEASAEQRRGRAGRLGPGICYRLWNEVDNHSLRPSGTPEILETDLLPLVLSLLAWGAEPEEMRWLDPPPPGPWGAAIELGRALGLVDSAGGLTETGRAALELPLHPRLARMVIAAGGETNEVRERTLLLAALLEEGDPLRVYGGSDPDLNRRLDLLRRFEEDDEHSPDLDRRVAARIVRQKERLRRISIRRKSRDSNLSLPSLVAIAYPDRIAMQRGAGGYLLSSGRPVQLPDESPLFGPFMVVPSVYGSGRTGVIDLAVSIDLDEIEAAVPERIRDEQRVFWDREAERVEVREDRLLDSITLSTRRVHDPDDDLIVRGTLAGIRELGISALPWGRRGEELRRRIAFLHYHADPEVGSGVSGEWPDVTDEALLVRLDEWLTPFLARGKGRNRLASLDMVEALYGLLGWRERSELDSLAPERKEVPNGSMVRIDYSRPEEPVLPVRIQFMFGSTETPRIAGGRVPLTLHLLSPAQRPVQITRDLEGFWKGSYSEVRKEMKGRYPKHEWPEDPSTVQPEKR